MRELIEKALKFTCLVLAVFLAYRFSHLAVRRNPLAGLSIPALPSLPSTTNSSASPASNTNATASSTNAASASAGTNTHVTSRLALVTRPLSLASATNLGTARRDSNAPPRETASRKESRASTKPRSSGPRGGREAAEKPPELPPAIQARVDRIYQSQLLGPVIRPSIMPAGLLGIAGNFAILRTTTGQTGLVKEGDELSGLKLLRVGINRVLVEQDGKQKELTLFDGFGGEPLLPPTKDNPK